MACCTYKVEDFTVMKVIGSGSFGQCSKIKRKSDRKILVWKQMNFSATDCDMIYKEIFLLCQLDHPYLIKYFGHILDSCKGIVYIITDFCECGDLSGFIDTIREHGGRLEEEDVWKVFCQLSLALEYCHQKRIIHRDVKPANIFIKKNKDVILGDFGVGRVLACDGPEMAQTQCGTPCYMSPESMGRRGYDEKTDVWSLGCVIYELCSLEMPFTSVMGQPLRQVVRSGKTKPIPSDYSLLLADTIKSMLTVQVLKRPSIAELVASPTLREKFAPLVSPAKKKAPAAVVKKGKSPK